MEEALRALNGLLKDGVIRAYAIGGAVGASFYVAALQTEDVDAFVYLPESDSLLTLLGSVYDALVAKGGIIEGAHVRFGAWPLQVLTDANALIGEAIREASTAPFRDVQTRVFQAEHLLAIALQTGRTKDYLRVEMLLEQGVVDKQKLYDVLSRHGLLARFLDRFGTNALLGGAE